MHHGTSSVAGCKNLEESAVPDDVSKKMGAQEPEWGSGLKLNNAGFAVCLSTVCVLRITYQTKLKRIKKLSQGVKFLFKNVQLFYYICFVLLDVKSKKVP